jgi:3-deoxy-manno-octulosonate cytidylyltransferase (CMP-KDO synthetase)
MRPNPENSGAARLEAIGIIPARYDSSRFPGKPLAPILGKPMFWHVYRRASRCRSLARVVLATDDERIAEAARSLHVPVRMTRREHPSGTDRVLEAALGLRPAAGAVIVNIQGDEPALAPEMIDELLAPFGDPRVAVATLARAVPAQEADHPDRVKVVFSASGRALYFSRARLPFCRRPEEGGTVFVHVGLYAFRLEALRRFVALAPSRLEQAEGLEQLRLLENDIPVHVSVTAHDSFGVDRPEDIERAAALIRRQRRAEAAGAEG